MIVTYTEKGWQIITQRTHGILAAQIGSQWKNSGIQNRWVETMLAIAEHDDAEVELDGEMLLTDQGGPLNFDMKTFDLVHCKNLASLSLTKSRYIALLTSMHMTFLYKEEESARDFLKEQSKLQIKWRHELSLTKTEVDKIYKLLQWCDALSLLLCQNSEQPEQRSIEISPGDKNTKFHLFKINDQQLTVNPWPFKASSFEIYFETRLISQLQFKSSAEFRQAFLNAPVKETRWQMKKTKVSSLGLKAV